MPAEANVEQWSEVHCGVQYQCFKTPRGELFHFRKNELKRGKPCAPFNTIEEFTRPYRFLTLQNAAHIAGLELHTIRENVRHKKLRTIKKCWKHGRHRRHGLLVDTLDLQEWMAKRSIEKHLGKRIDWDYSALGLLGRGEI